MDNTISRYYANNATPTQIFNAILLNDLEPTPLERKAHIDTMAKNAIREHYVSPDVFLTAYDYSPLTPLTAQFYAERARTDWNHEAMRTIPWMICQYTGYTRNQMLAAMLNDTLYNGYDLIMQEREYANQVEQYNGMLATMPPTTGTLYSKLSGILL